MASVSVKVHEVFCVVQHYFSSVCLSVAVPACGVRVPFAHLSTFSTVPSKANSVCVRQTDIQTDRQRVSAVVILVKLVSQGNANFCVALSYIGLLLNPNQLPLSPMPLSSHCVCVCYCVCVDMV